MRTQRGRVSPPRSRSHKGWGGADPGPVTLPMVTNTMRREDGSRHSRFPLCLALWVTIVGARWWIIGKYASDVPWLDQWAAEAGELYTKFAAGSLSFSDWIAPYNEHRILFTRLLALGLLLLNGQWDPRLQMEVNAVIYAGVACWLFLALTRDRSLIFSLLAVIGLGLLFTLPFGMTNTLLGFQSQFYLLIGFSFCSMYMLLNSVVGSWTFLAGILVGAAALLTMGSGMVSPAVVLGVLMLASVRRSPSEESRVHGVWRALSAGLILALGLLIRTTNAESTLAARSIGQFAEYLIVCLAWPTKAGTIGALLIWMPLLAFLVRYVKGTTDDKAIDRFTLGVGVWVGLQAVALALFRANSGEGLESRYTDILGFGLIANALSVARLGSRSRGRRKLIAGFMLIWVTVATIGLYRSSFSGAMANWRFVMELHRTNVAGFVATGDFGYLQRGWLPYPHPQELSELLEQPSIRPILPVAIRPSLPLVPALGSPQPAYVEMSRPAWGAAEADYWNRTGIFSKFAVLQPHQRFGYSAERTTSLPFLLTLVNGNTRDVFVLDEYGSAHGLLTLPLTLRGGWRLAFAKVPTRKFTLGGRSGPMGLSFMEPKELGGLSALAIACGLLGKYVFVCGLSLLVIAGIVAASFAVLNRRQTPVPEGRFPPCCR